MKKEITKAIKVYTNSYLGYEYTLMATSYEAFVTFFQKRRICSIYDYKFSYPFHFYPDFVKEICEKIVLYQVLGRDAIENTYI